jgi:hypothetical protein
VLPDLENEIHVAGLLHDVGIALLIHHLPEDYARVLEAARRREERLAGAEKEEFGVSHAEVGHSLAARSRLPPLICDCIRCHETPAEGSFQPAPQLAEALEVLALAHAWAVGRGFALWQGDSFSSPVEAPSSWRLGAEDLARLLEDAAADVAARETDFFPPGRDVLIDRRAPSGAPAASH